MGVRRRMGMSCSSQIGRNTHRREQNVSTGLGARRCRAALFVQCMIAGGRGWAHRFHSFHSGCAQWHANLLDLYRLLTTKTMGYVPLCFMKPHAWWHS
jgi:hypothetical protein